MKVLAQRIWTEPVVALAAASATLEIAALGLPAGKVAVVAAIQAVLTRRLVSPTRSKRR